MLTPAEVRALLHELGASSCRSTIDCCPRAP